MKDYEAHIDRLIDIANDIEPNKVNILVGSNGSGKSLIRSVLSEAMKSNHGIGCASTSMAARTSSNAAWGALSGIMRDDDWVPTSYCTINAIEGLFKAAIEKKDESSFITIDEPEIGMGEETVVALCNFLNETFKTNIGKGVLIITHNRYLVENLKCDNFFSIEEEYETQEDWLNREIVPTDLEALKDNKLFYAVRDRIKAAKKSNA